MNPLETLKLLAVYFASCGIAIGLVRRFLSPAPRRVLWAISLLPFLLAGRALLTGSFYGPLNMSYQMPPLRAGSGSIGEQDFHDGILSDVAIQMVPWRKAVRESLKHGRLPLWNRFILSGDVLLGAAQPAAFSPGTLLSCALPLATAWTFSCAYTSFLAAFFGFLFLRDVGLRDPFAVFGAATWMLSGFMVLLLGWPHGSVFAVAPLLFLGVRRLRSRSGGGFGATLAALVLVALGGHPESMLHVVAAGGLFLLLDLAVTRARPWAPLGRGAAAGLIAFGLAAPVLLPFLQAEPESVDYGFRKAYWVHHKKSHSLPAALALAHSAAYPDAYGPVWSPGNAQPPDFLDTANASIGGAALILAVAGMLSRRREKWPLGFVALLANSVAVGFPGVTDIVSRLPLFDLALNVRLAGIAAFCLAMLAAFGLEEVCARPRALNRTLLAAAGVAFVLGGLALRRAGRFPATRGFIVWPLALPAAAVLLLILLSAPRKGFRLVPLAFASLIAVRLMELQRLYPSISARLFYPPVPELTSLPRSADPYRVTATGYNLVPNQSALYELEDPRGYEGLTNRRYASTYPLWCVPQAVWFNRIDDLTKPFLSFLNVRFAIGGPQDPAPPGWRDFTRGKNCAVFENTSALPRAFMPLRIDFVPDAGSAIARMGEIRDFRSTAVVEESASPVREVPNGAGTVSTARDGASLLLTVSALQRCWIVVSETAWSGWKATDNGRPLPLRYANGAFLGFEVGPGNHRVKLEYWPVGFTIGLALAGASVLVLVGIALVARRGARVPRRKTSSGDPISC